MGDVALPERQGGLSAGGLKWIAIVAMLIDHSATAFFADYYAFPAALLHFVGRITGPVMFYFIAEGYHHTRNKNRYTLRLFLFALLSYLPFIYFRWGTLPGVVSWNDFNVIYTLLLGHLCLRALHELRQPWLKWPAILLAFLASYWGDWGSTAILCILLFDMLRGSFKQQALAYCLVVLVVHVMPALMAAAGGGGAGYLAQAGVLCGMFLPILLLRFYNGRRGRGSRWLFYVFYPAHLLVLGLLRWLVLV